MGGRPMMFFPVVSWKIPPDTGLMKVNRTGTKKPGILKRKEVVG
jgi:hypothetical protein